MAGKALFLSHITEEKALAAIIKEAIENEFSGFVEVFVSSDGISIPAGSNFLKRITTSLIDCIGAIYLISPMSVRRPWINFELGAVWIRSAISEAGGNQEIPALPFCHSGMTLGNLPPPIGSLNAILANEPSQLKFAFTSLQAAVGGRGALRTNFDELAAKIRSFEDDYTLLDRLREFFHLIGSAPASVIELIKKNSGVDTVGFGTVHFTEREFERISALANKELKGIVTIGGVGFLTSVGEDGAKSGPTAEISCKSAPIMKLEGR